MVAFTCTYLAAGIAVVAALQAAENENRLLQGRQPEPFTGPFVATIVLLWPVFIPQILDD